MPNVTCPGCDRQIPLSAEEFGQTFECAVCATRIVTTAPLRNKRLLQSSPGGLSPGQGWLLVGFVACTVLVCSGVLFMSRKTETKQQLQQPADEARAGDNLGQPVATIPGVVLWSEYGENALQADQKYLGKVVQITGTIDNVVKDASGRYFAGIQTVSRVPLPEEDIARMSPQEKRWWMEGYPPNVRCYLSPAHQTAFANVKADAQASILGRCAGVKKDDSVYRGYFVVLEDCRLAE
jgi:hypothetical protein